MRSDDAGEFSKSSARLRARVGVTSIFFANGFAIGAWAVAIPQMKALFGLSDAGLSLILLAMGVGSLSAMPVAGLLPARAGGTGRVLQSSGPASAVLLALLPATHSLPAPIFSLSICAVLFGFLTTLVDVPMNAHASLIERASGKAIISSFHAAWSGGGLAGSALGGALIAFGASALMQLFASAAVVIFIAVVASRQIGIGDTHRGGPVFALPERRLVGLGVIALLAVFSEASVTDWSALYLHSELGVSPAAAASAFSSYAFMMFLGRLAGDAIVRRLGRKRVIVFGAAMIFIGVALVVGKATAPAAVVGFCLVGLGVANMVPAVFSASAAAAKSPSIGIAMTATLAYAAYLGGPPLIGFIAAATNLRTAFVVLLASSVVIALLAATVRND